MWIAKCTRLSKDEDQAHSWKKEQETARGSEEQRYCNPMKFNTRSQAQQVNYIK